MLKIVRKNDNLDDNLEKFRSDIAKIVEEQGKEGFKKKDNELESLLDYSFDSRYNPALEKAMENMKIEGVKTTTQISLDDFDNKERTSSFINNISVTLNAHGNTMRAPSPKKGTIFLYFFQIISYLSFVCMLS